MDNWHEGKRTGRTLEPDDATIQLEGLGRQLAAPPGEPASPDGSDGPVFVDESGRRSKTFRRLGWVLAAICAGYAVTLVFAVLGGNSSAPWLPLSGPGEEAQVEKAEVGPTPVDAADDPSDGFPEPAPSASGSAGDNDPGSATPSATSAPPPAGPDGRASASASTAPSSAGAGSAGATEPTPSAPTAEPPVDPPPPSPAPEPSEPTSAPTRTPDLPVQEESAP